jgi:hypothetical protein
VKLKHLKSGFFDLGPVDAARTAANAGQSDSTLAIGVVANRYRYGPQSYTIHSSQFGIFKEVREQT